jgi:PilZ domain-containing protein
MTQTGSRPRLLSVGNVLLVCKDADAIRLLTDAVQQFALSLDVHHQADTAARMLGRQKFEAVVVDLELGDGAKTVLREVYLSSSNQTAVTFTITSRNAEKDSGMMGSTFTFVRPLSVESISLTLKAAYGLIVRERRRYFRFPLAVPAFLRTAEGKQIESQTVNIGEGGMGLHTSHPFKAKEKALVQFAFPDPRSQFSAELDVCWYDQSGRLGVRFLALSAQQKSGLREWLSAKFEESIPERVAAHFRKSAAKP